MQITKYGAAPFFLARALSPFCTSEIWEMAGEKEILIREEITNGLMQARFNADLYPMERKSLQKELKVQIEWIVKRWLHLNVCNLVCKKRLIRPRFKSANPPWADLNCLGAFEIARIYHDHQLGLATDDDLSYALDNHLRLAVKLMKDMGLEKRAKGGAITGSLLSRVEEFYNEKCDKRYRVMAFIGCDKTVFQGTHLPEHKQNLAIYIDVGQSYAIRDMDNLYKYQFH